MKNSKINKIIAKLSAFMIITTSLLFVNGCQKEKGWSKKPVQDITTTTAATTETTAAETTTEPVSIPLTSPNYNRLTGLEDISPEYQSSRPLAIAISNSKKARPQWGISSADICIEAMVEGGETRLVGIFSDWSKIPKIGPVRSARHDFLELCSGLGGIYVHAGGSPQALENIKSYNLDTVNALRYDGSYFLRDSVRRKNQGLEFSMYTDSELLQKAIQSLNFDTTIDAQYQEPFIFADPGSLSEPSDGECKELNIAFSGASNFKHTFSYDDETGVYLKKQGNSKMLDANNDEQVSYTNVLVIYSVITQLNTTAGHIDMDLSSGHGIYVANGKYQEIKWEKGESESPLRFYDANGNGLTLNPGKTYIGVVPSNREDDTKIKPE